MKTEFTIFYSWQSDILENKKFISKCLEKARTNLNKELKTQLNLKLVIDRDTKKTSGSINISSEILKKIEKCDILISDVSIINKPKWKFLPSERKTPNPNVLIELGFGISTLGWERIIMINNLEYSRVEDLPFDIRGHRISNYNKNGDEENLVIILTAAVKQIILNFDEILLNRKSDSIKDRDIRLFKEFDSQFSQNLIFASLDYVNNNHFTLKSYYSLWDKIELFQKNLQNEFINTELQKLFIEFGLKLSDLYYYCLMQLHYYKEFGHDDEMYRYNKEPFPNESNEDFNKRTSDFNDKLWAKVDLVKEAYKIFIRLGNKELSI
ncbi:MAG TPA: hypothetical protein VK175_20385 [Leadbetterella sp.]|nr:hypothetical protein [Leadbetterella sp.]